MANLIAKTTFENAPLQDLDSEQWKSFWDQYGFGRYDNGGGKVPRRGAGLVEIDGEKAIEMRFAAYDDSFHQSANSNGLMIWKSKPVSTTKELFIEYDHKLADNFSFGGEIVNGDKRYSGGKMGLSIQTIDTTTNSKPPINQFTVVLMWRDGQEGSAELEPYVYHSNQLGTNPDREHTNFFIKPGDRHTYGLHWKIDGYVGLYVDGILIWERNDYNFSNSNEIPVITSVSNFNGGSGAGWAHKNDCEAYLYSAKLYDTVPYGNADPEKPTEENPKEEPVIVEIDLTSLKQELIDYIDDELINIESKLYSDIDQNLNKKIESAKISISLE